MRVGGREGGRETAFGVRTEGGGEGDGALRGRGGARCIHSEKSIW